MRRAGLPNPSAVTRRDRGEPQSTRIEALTHDGLGVGRIDGKAVFVADALPGETVRIQPMRRRKGHDEARLLEIIDASAQRVEPRCDYFGVCGGCVLQHLAHPGQLAAKQTQLVSALARIGKVEPLQLSEPVSGQVWAYRRRARLGVRWVRAKDRVLVGFRERGGSFLADMDHCEILAAGGRDLPGQLAGLIAGLSIRARIPQVEVTVADNGLALVLRVLDAPNSDDLDAIARFASLHNYRVFLQPGGLDSVTLHCGDTAPLYYEIDKGRIRIEFEPTDFVQINAQLNEKMVGIAMRALELEAGESLLDLFCGLGNFSLPAARRGARVTGIEGEPALVARAQANARLNARRYAQDNDGGVDAGSENDNAAQLAARSLAQARFFVSNLFDDVGDFPWSRQAYEKVLLDPPRAGARAIVARMADIAPRKIVYVSCHPGTLARDAAILAAQGYSLASAGIVDMFPHTAHVESIAVFERR